MAAMAAAADAIHPSTADTAPAALVPSPGMPMRLQPHVLVTDAYAKDAIIAWYRGEFAAANAIIDALCSHLVELGAGLPEVYEAVFAAMHRRRMNWIPLLQMQKYHSVAEVAVELKRAAAAKRAEDGNRSGDVAEKATVWLDEKKDGKRVEAAESAGAGDVDDDSPVSDITDSGSQVMQPMSEDSQVCSNHEDCQGRRALIKLTKGFKAKETVKGRKVNVLKGMKLYEEVFTGSQISKLTSFVNELRLAGQRGQLSGESFILFNKQSKGSKRELIQFGLPIFKPLQEEATNNNELCNTEPFPELLQGVIDHLVEWELLPAHKKPNGCIINFFDEGEYSQPFLKPPHLDHPISTLLLSESTMAFGCFLASDGEGNYNAPLMLSIKEGSLLVMRGNSVDVARHAMCPSPCKRIAITFFHVRSKCNPVRSHGAPPLPSPSALPNCEALEGYEAVDAVPKWGVLHAPVAILTAPVQVATPTPEKVLCGGTGVFLPWAVRSTRRVKRLPPRAQKAGRVLE